MEQSVSAENVHLEQRRSGEGLRDCLRKIKEKEEHEKRKEKVKKLEGADNGIEEYTDKEENTSKPEDTEPSLADKLLEALDKNDAVEVWELVENNSIYIKTLESLDKACVVVAEKENSKEKGCHCKCNCDCITAFCCGFCRCCKDSSANEQQDNNAEKNDDEKWKWIKVLSNPLFISVEWLWRRNTDFKCAGKGLRKERKNEDVIQAALDDAYLLEKIALYEHHYSRDEYKSAIEAFEKFAADVIEGSTSIEHYDDKIMDIEGNGCLLTGEPNNFIQSLSLLKIAANKGRKKFVASPRCQFILNKIIYYKWEDWQDKSTVKKIGWFFLQVILIAIGTLFYIPFRICKKMRTDMCDKCCCSNTCTECCLKKCSNCSEWTIESWYEHPYSKFINHTISYLAFVSLLFASTFGFENEYRTSTSGISRIDWAVLVFVAGLVFQECWEAFKQGFRVYFSKWWNIVDTITLSAFLAAYTVWFAAWRIVYGEWQPRKSPFIVADVLYASATVMAFFRMTHFFQVNSTLGPLQLSLYRMLKDVLKFLLIFLMLYIAFATGIVKVYSYYVASQMKLRDHDNSHFQESHPYAKHENTFIGLVWLLVGYVEEDKIVVDDPAFNLTSIFGRLGLVAYLICTTIVALNMLIAMMNNSYERVMEDADNEWKLSRAQMWLEWIDKGNAIPVPFNLVYYAFHLLYVFKICQICKMGKWPCCDMHMVCTSVTTDAAVKDRGTQMQTGSAAELLQQVEQGSGDQMQTGSGAELGQAVEQGSGDQTPSDCCGCSCFSYTCHCISAVKSNVDAKKKRMDAMEYLVWRYLNDKHFPEFGSKSKALGMSQADIRTGQVENGVK